MIVLHDENNITEANNRQTVEVVNFFIVFGVWFSYSYGFSVNAPFEWLLDSIISIE